MEQTPIKGWDGANWPFEVCDDGVLNGTSESHCDRNCNQAPSLGDLSHLRQANLQFSALSSVTIQTPGDNFGLAYTEFDDSGVHAIRELHPWNFDGSTNPIVNTLKVSGAPLALGSTQLHNSAVIVPAWMERSDQDGSLHLYWARLPTDNEVEIHELPYPFTDGGSPSFIEGVGHDEIVIVDHSRTPPHDLLVVVFVVHDNLAFTTRTWRFPAPNKQHRVLVAGYGKNWTFQPHKQIVQFYDTGAFVNLEEVRLDPSPLPHEATDIDVVMRFTGTWPFQVAGGDMWGEWISTLIPGPLAVISPSGDIYTWQFSSSPEAEQLTPFASVQPGSLIQWFSHGGYMALWTLQPDGRLSILFDGDSLSITSSALQPITYNFSVPWTRASVVRGSSAIHAFTIDGVLFAM
ncbi:MAG: hypothetical protein NT062_36775 [Proteobacteria bacterium]|nr:hypothetical protein [Pseudomonadota bacterium]